MPLGNLLDGGEDLVIVGAPSGNASVTFFFRTSSHQDAPRSSRGCIGASVARARPAAYCRSRLSIEQEMAEFVRDGKWLPVWMDAHTLDRVGSSPGPLQNAIYKPRM